MAIVSKGYAGQIAANQDWAFIQRGLGSLYWVESSGHCKVVPKSDGVRQITVIGGYCGGSGVRDQFVGDTVVQLPTVASGTQWFLIVARRTWGTSQATTIEIIPAGSSPVIPARNVSPGVIDDQPLALVPLTAGQNVPGTPRDLRLVKQYDGIYACYDDLVLGYANWWGAQVRNAITGLLWMRVSTAGGGGAWETYSGTLEKAVGGAFLTGAPGFSQYSSATGTPVFGGNRMLRDGHNVQYDIRMRHSTTGGQVQFDATGGLTDRLVGTLTRYKPDIAIYTTFSFLGGDAKTDAGSYSGSVKIDTDGTIRIIAGPKSLYINTDGTRDAFRLGFSFLKETV